jgi:hypothetical protein
MAIRSLLTPEDLAERKTDPGWYKGKIKDVKEEVVKGSEAKPSDGSMNAIFYFDVWTDTKNPDAKPREMRRYFNEKALGFGRNLWYVTGLLTKGSTKPQELTFEMMQSLIGKEMLVYIKKNTAGFDNIEDWRPLPVAS